MVVGESHYHPHSRKLIIQLMDYCYNELSFQTLAVEYPHQMAITKAQSNEMEKLGLNYCYYLRKANKDRWHIVPVDKEHDLKLYDPRLMHSHSMQIRNQTMVAELLKSIHRDTLLIVGANHLAGLGRGDLNRLLLEKFDLLLINTVDYSHSIYAGSLEATWIMDEKNAIQLKI